MRWRSLIPALLCLALQPLWCADPAHEPAKKEAADKKQAEKSQAGQEGFDIPVPLGIPVKGIKIPHRNEEGKLVMTIEA